MESATVAYVQRLSTVFFTNILESSMEFRRAFPPGGTTKAASFLVWVEEELAKFCTDRIERQVIVPFSISRFLSKQDKPLPISACRGPREGQDLSWTFRRSWRYEI